MRPNGNQVKEVRLPLNTNMNSSIKKFLLVELKISLGREREVTRPILIDKEFEIPYEFPRLRIIEKELRKHKQHLALSQNR